MKQILVVKPGSISDETKKMLFEEGVILIETEKPNEIRVINEIDGFEGNEIFNCAIDSIVATVNTDFTKNKFASLLLNAIQKKRPVKKVE